MMIFFIKTIWFPVVTCVVPLLPSTSSTASHLKLSEKSNSPSIMVSTLRREVAGFEKLVFSGRRRWKEKANARRVVE